MINSKPNITMTKKKDKEPAPTEDETYCTAAYLADVLHCSVRHVQALRAAGVLVREKTPQGVRYKRLDSLFGYARYLLAKDEERSAKRRIDKAEAEYKKRKAELAKIELRKRRGEVHEARHVEAAIKWVIDSTRAAFSPLPDEVAPKIAACRSEAEIFAVLKEAMEEKMRMLATAPAPAFDEIND